MDNCKIHLHKETDSEQKEDQRDDIVSEGIEEQNGRTEINESSRSRPKYTENSASEKCHFIEYDENTKNLNFLKQWEDQVNNGYEQNTKTRTKAGPTLRSTIPVKQMCKVADPVSEQFMRAQWATQQ